MTLPLDMANLIIVTGPQAVGKMTVAERLRDKTFALTANDKEEKEYRFGV